MGVQRHSIHRIADVALDHVACVVGIAHWLPADSADEQSEFGVDVVETVASAAVELTSVSRNVLLAFAAAANRHAEWSGSYTGGTKGALGWI